MKIDNVLTRTKTYIMKYALFKPYNVKCFVLYVDEDGNYKIIIVKPWYNDIIYKALSSESEEPPCLFVTGKIANDLVIEEDGLVHTCNIDTDSQPLFFNAEDEFSYNPVAWNTHFSLTIDNVVIYSETKHKFNERYRLG